jgi:hypothetical protein
MDGDVAFFCFRETRYEVLLRRRRELEDSDAVGRLLWSCGMDPADGRNRRDLWHRVGAALGASGPSPDNVRRRLGARRDRELLELVALAEAATSGSASRVWPDGWQYVVPLDDRDASFALLAGNGDRRVAVGVVDVSGQPDETLIVTDGGLAWVEDDATRSTDARTATGAQLSRGLIPAARRPEWNRWLRAEHRLRLTGLSGLAFAVARDSRGWWPDGTRYDSPLGVLDKLDPPREAILNRPREPARMRYPRSAFAFDRALASAESRGLVMLSADPRSGILATYDDGREITGSTLLDVFGAHEQAER